jgi:hypothetical protein
VAIVSNDALTIPLYHGTTTLFEESIRQHGLGGKNPLHDLNAYSTFQEVFNLGDNTLGDDELWKKSRYFLEPILHQAYLGGNNSFKHGESYLTTNPELASKYAYDCVVGGCEYLYYLKVLIDMLRFKNVEGVESLVNSSIRMKLDHEYRPVLVTLPKVLVTDIDTETGRSLDGQLIEIDEALKSGIHTPFGFKLINRYTSDRLVIETLA